MGIFKESESYFRNLVNSAPIAIVMTDRGGKCLYVNDYWKRLSGLTLQHSIGSGWQSVIHREDVGRMGVWWYGEKKDNSGPGTVCRIIPADGEVKKVELKSSPFYDDDGVMIGYIALFAELSENLMHNYDALPETSSSKSAETSYS